MFEFFKWVFIKEAILHCLGCVGVFLFYIAAIIVVWILIEWLVYMARKDRKK